MNLSMCVEGVGSEWQKIGASEQIVCEKLHTKPAQTWTAVSTFIRSHQQAFGNQTNEWTPVGFEPSISAVKSFHLTTCVTGSVSHACTIGLS